LLFRTFLIIPEKCKKLKEKNKQLKSRVKELEVCTAASRSDEVELKEGSGIYVNRRAFETALAVSKSPLGLSRSIFKLVFGSKIIASHSLFGHQEGLPTIDEAKRNAIIGKKNLCLI
jgi:hypothetical protein